MEQDRTSSQSTRDRQMTAPRRIVPLAQVKEVFDFLKEQGIVISECSVDIGPDYVKVSPPANSNAGDSLGDYINRPAHRSQKAAKR